METPMFEIGEEVARHILRKASFIDLSQENL
jgi:hypothetical protein